MFCYHAFVYFSEQNVYFYRIYFTDQSTTDHGDKRVVWKIKGDNSPSTFIVPRNANNFPITRRTTSQPGSAQDNVVTVYSRANKQLYVNDRLEFQPRPLKEGNDGNRINIGEPIKKRLYYFRMLVSNLHNRPALLKWNVRSVNNEVETQSRIIPAYYFNYVVFSNIESYEKPDPVELSSYVNGSTVELYTNDQRAYPIQPVRERRPAFINVYISTYITARDTAMLFNNPTSSDMVVTWKTRGYKGTATVPAKSKAYQIPVTISGGFRNQNVIISAESTEGEEALINSNDNIKSRLPHSKPFIIDFVYKDIIFNNTLPSSDVTVTDLPGGIVKVVPAATHVSYRILMKRIPDNGITFTAVSDLDQSSTTINGEPNIVIRRDNTVSRMQIGAKEQIARQYFIKLWLVNNHTNNVALRWGDRDGQSSEIKPNFNGERMLSFNSDDPVTLTALDAVTNNDVYLNRRQQLSLRPTSDVKYATNVVISGEIALYDYFYRLIVNNERSTDVDIVLKLSLIHI